MWFEDDREPREGLRSLYGVELPEEYFAVAAANDDLPVNFLFRPRLQRVPPGLFPVLQLNRHTAPRSPSGRPTPPPARHGGLLLCYRLSELESGRTTIFGVTTEKPAEVSRLGDSLLVVLHQHIADIAAIDEWEFVQPFNWGAGALSSEDIDLTRAWLELIRSLLRDEKS